MPERCRLSPQVSFQRDSTLTFDFCGSRDATDAEFSSHGARNRAPPGMLLAVTKPRPGCPLGPMATVAMGRRGDACGPSWAMPTGRSSRRLSRWRRSGIAARGSAEGQPCWQGTRSPPRICRSAKPTRGAVRLLVLLSCSATGAPDVGAAMCPLNGATARGAGGMGRGSISTPFQGVPITQH